MLSLLLASALNAQEFSVTYQCRPDYVTVYDDTGLRKVHIGDWERVALVGEAGGYAQAVEATRAKVQDAFKRAREQAAELQYYTIRDMLCRKRIAAGGEAAWNVLYGKDNRMKYSPATRLSDEREFKVAGEAPRSYAPEP